MSFHFVLVHGTRAPGASWTDPEQSALCRHLRAAFGDEISFSSPIWSGRNTHQARVDGARKLRQEVRETANDGRATILIGHSHGGSVIAYALAEDEALCRQVAGVIFLATPFVHARPLPLGKHLPKGPALVAGLLCGMAVVLSGALLLSTTGWPDESSRALDLVAIALPYSGFLVWWAVFHMLGRFMGVSEGRVTERTKERLSALVNQLDLSALETRGVSGKTLIIRSTADEASSGLATAQFSGRLASDLPSVVWLVPQRAWARMQRRVGLDRSQPPGWTVWAFFSFILAVLLGFTIRGAAWLSDWAPLERIDEQVRAFGSSASQAAVTAFVWIAVGIVLVIAITVPLVAIALPFKLAGLWLYGLRGWPLFQALYLELSVEPAPPGEWRIHQLDSRLYEWEVERERERRRQLEIEALVDRDPAEIERAIRVMLTDVTEEEETTLAHSYVYNDPRAHRAIEKWLKTATPELT